MAAHTHWRLYIGAMASAYAQLGTVSFLNAAQVNQSTGGTATASSEYIGPWAAGNAFDGNPTSEWASAGVSSSEWIAYQHPSPVDIVFVGVKVSASYPVSGLALQYSDDGVSWSAASPLYVLDGQPALTTGSYTVLGLSASRRPLVVVDGRIKELPEGDTLPPQAPAAHTHPATSITNTPAGGVAATNVQAAIDELDAEKANAASVREKLTANRTYYVRTDGNDSNNGLANTSGGAFLTIQKAVDVCAAIDLGIYDATIMVGAGTWTAATTLKTLVGAGKVIIRGVNDDMTSTVISVSGSNCFSGAFVGQYKISHMRLTGTGVCIDIFGGGAIVRWADVDFAAATMHVRVFAGALGESAGNYKISGSAYSHIGSYDFGNVRVVGHSVTITGTPNFSGAFCLAARLAEALIVSAVFSGSATGARYSVHQNSVIYTGAGELYLPGDAAGTKSTGGHYE